MIRTSFSRLAKARKGGAMIEFATTLPLVVLVSLAVADFGRLFMESSVLATASGSGAVYAYRTTRNAADLGGAEAAVLNNLNGLDEIAADVTKVCDCPGAPKTWVSCQSMCTGYGRPRVYVRSTASQSFQTIGVYPGVPSNVNMGVSSWLRVQ
jgi:Flp pilus assembly protein TadG